ncbi:MAG: TRAP transporter TatT component family protein, partial [Gammaproteobacteria bacterium]|nr:TRAP transporter TatT component family protein [Gammaproteobacteria bacterium]
VRNASDAFSRNLGAAVLDSEDPATVRDGLPAYLLLLDSLVAGQKPGEADNASVLLAAAKLNGAYAGNFTGDDKLRARRLSEKSFRYARVATCLQDAPLCEALDGDPERFAAVVAADTRVELMYVLASSWAGYLQANSEEWGAIADLPKIQSLLERVVQLDASRDQGQAWVYLGVLNSLRPEAIGGKPELGRQSFERAIAISGGRNLYAKTLFAEFYARLVFDQELHDRLLNEVLAADPRAPGLTLTNTLAQDRARKLLESGKDYF